MPRYRVFLTDLVTAGFDIEAATPETAADEVRELGTGDGESIHAEMSRLEVFGTDAYGNMVPVPMLYSWPSYRVVEGGESDG